jgi:hypothetical protein
MATILIKKKVALDFLGKEYEDSFLTFKSMPISEYEKLIGELEGADNKSSLKLTVKILKDNFIEGKFQGEDVTKEDLEQFDIETLVKCLEIFTGQSQSPKV